MTANIEQVGRAQRPEHLWMVALYDEEERTAELLVRLEALGVDAGEATIVRVALDEAAVREATLAADSDPAPSVSLRARHAVTGAIIGSSAALLIGVLLYGTRLIRLGFIEGMFAHAVASSVVGALFGAIIGAAIAVFGARGRSAAATSARPASNPSGFLVAVKLPPGLAEQAEAIARHLGAKKILL
jgi:hypothetical protein